MSMSSVEGSPARTFLVPEKEQESMLKGVASGGKCSGSFAWYDQNSSLWRTWQLCLTGGLMKYLDRWPKAGMMRNGLALELLTSDFLTEENVSFLLPTPRADMGKKPVCFARIECDQSENRHNARDNLEDYLAMNLNAVRVPGEPLTAAPSFVEKLMGYPSKWTDLEHSETP